MIEKLSDGDPSVLAIGMYGEPQVGFDSVLGTKLIDQLKKMVGVYHVHPLETDYKKMPEVDFAITMGPPARARMLGEDFQEYDRGTSFQQTVMKRTRVARIIFQEWPWRIPPEPIRSIRSMLLNFSFGPLEYIAPWPDQWGKGWFSWRGVYWLYPFADKRESRPEAKRDFVFVDCPSSDSSLLWDFSEPLIKALKETGVDYFQGPREFKDRIPHKDFVSKLNQAKLYFQVKAESYSMISIEAVASEAIVLGTYFTLRRVYVDEFKFTVMPDNNIVTLKKAIATGLKVYDDPTIRKRLRKMRRKLWDYRRLTREIADAMRSLKGRVD